MGLLGKMLPRKMLAGNILPGKELTEKMLEGKILPGKGGWRMEDEGREKRRGPKDPRRGPKDGRIRILRMPKEDREKLY